MSNRISGIIKSYNGHIGVIASPTGELFFRADNVLRFCTVKPGDSVTFLPVTNTSEEGGMDMAVHIVTDGTSIPQVNVSEAVAQIRAKETERRARVVLAVKRRRNSAEVKWFKMMGW